jgi:2-phosphosulfolactate phosphatase
MTKRIHCEWGRYGAMQSRDFDVAILVDVLSFSTAVDAAVSAGAAVYPFAWTGDRAAAIAEATAFAQDRGATLAQQRQDSGTLPTLSPPTLTRPNQGDRLVLPSPNGSLLTTKTSATHIFAACLRNYPAVASAANALSKSIIVIAAGEKWPDGSLRPALEDWLGAGAVLSELSGPFTTEAEAARRSFLNGPDVPNAVLDCISGRELRSMGFQQDADFAVKIGVSPTVPQLTRGAYQQRNQ